MHLRFGTAAFVLTVLAGTVGCSSNQNPGVAQNGAPATSTSGTDPADNNFASNTPAQSAPPPANNSNTGNYQDSAPYQGASYQDTADFSGQQVYAQQPPPPIPDYTQPECPGPNYIWTPGYWNNADSGYYWVPGVWVLAPYVDALWTPPWWEFYEGRYRWHRGYWGPHIGYYGGVNYGFGYTGQGYFGGYWNQGQFAYNRSVNNVNLNVVHNVYNRQVNNFTTSRVSYNGGPGGLNVRPTGPELAAERQPRQAPLPAQITHSRDAASNRQQFAAANGGRPQITAAARPLAVNYRAPAAPTQAIQRTIRPEAAAPIQAGQRSQPEGRQQPGERPNVNARPGAPEPAAVNRQNIPGRPEPAQQGNFRPVPQQQQPPQQAARPQENRPAPAPVQRQQPQPAARMSPAAPRSEPARPSPLAARPESAPRPQQEARPAPAPRPQQEARPAPAPAPRPQPEARPQPAARPAPAPRQAPQPREEEKKR